MALFGHEVELHYYSLEPMASQNPRLATAEELKQKYQRKITEEIRPKCAKPKVFLRGGGKFQIYLSSIIAPCIDEF